MMANTPKPKKWQLSHFEQPFKIRFRKYVGGKMLLYEAAVMELREILYSPQMDKYFAKSSGDDSKSKGKAQESANDLTVPWVENRPQKVDDIVFQDEVVAVLKKAVQGSDLPNYLFYGPPGTGKTSAAVAFCRQLFKAPEAYHERVLELNASDERGINVVRGKIKDFSRRAVTTTLPDGSPVAGIKVIILDEADAMTLPAQAALRRTMEKESRTTRFFIICNYISRIIDPLTSRCSKFRFKPLSVDAQRERLKMICEKENVEIEPDAIDELINICEGDLRRSITCLQTISSCHKKLSIPDIQELSSVIPDAVVQKFITVCHSANFEDLIEYIDGVLREGFGVYQLMKQLFPIFMKSEELLDTHKAVIFQKMAVCEMRILDGANGFLQILDLAAVVQDQYKSAV
uniref:AAA domain-containing protein n=1 Tax=Syphacia muris TaxID=451379 RepID=A0A0N5AVR3_9BILA